MLSGFCFVAFSHIFNSFFSTQIHFVGNCNMQRLSLSTVIVSLKRSGLPDHVGRNSSVKHYFEWPWCRHCWRFHSNYTLLARQHPWQLTDRTDTSCQPGSSFKLVFFHLFVVITIIMWMEHATQIQSEASRSSSRTPNEGLESEMV